MGRIRIPPFPGLLGMIALTALTLGACTDSPELSDEPEVPDIVVRARIDSLRTLWSELRPSYDGSPYALLPFWEGAPYEAGELAPEFVDDGLNTLLFLRYVAGLRAPVQVGDYREDTQHGAVLLAHGGELLRAPDQPADMEDIFYASALNGLAGSNLAAGSALARLPDAIAVWLDESAPTGRLTNRRWLLNPRMARTGFGYVEGFALLYVVDTGRTPTAKEAVVAWPAPVATPVEFFSAESYWSVALHPDVYLAPSAAEVTVTVTRRSDGRSWVLDASTGESEADGSWFVVDGAAAPDPAIIFRPGSDAVPVPGATFDVEIAGLRYTGGGAADVAYEVTFFSLTR
jgi:hypothetical protein